MKSLCHFVGEGEWWSTEGLNKRLIREEDVNVTGQEQDTSCGAGFVGG